MTQSLEIDLKNCKILLLFFFFLPNCNGPYFAGFYEQNGASPAVGQDGHPPALDEAQVVVGQLHPQGQLGHPDGELQGCAQVLVAEDDPGVHGASRLLAVDKHVVAIHGDLPHKREGKGQGKERGSIWERSPQRGAGHG